jgi:hypothetical protein
MYQVMTNHYAPKDSHRAIWGYLIASSNEDVYEWLKSEQNVSDNLGSLYLCWNNWENDDEAEYLQLEDKFKTQMIAHRDEEETDRAEYTDLYYGRTFVSWDKVCDDILPSEIFILKQTGVRIFECVINKDEANNE